MLLNFQIRDKLQLGQTSVGSRHSYHGKAFQMKEANQGQRKISRRAVLKGGAAAMPVVLTLQSGSALARSSNLISEAPPGTTDLSGNTLCLDTRTAYSVGDSTKFDLGEPAHGVVNVIPQQAFYTEPNRGGDLVRPGTMCRRGGTYYYPNRGWHEVNLPTDGIIVSATAITSVMAQGQILFNRIA